MSDRIPDDCIVFDTETTGFDPESGDRLVELGAVRMRDGLPTSETFHRYINPQRSVPDAAVKVHNLTARFLQDKPLFEEVVDPFLAFVGDLPLIAHNAAFDEKFINAELARLGKAALPAARFVDTVPIAKRRFPGQKVNLDALCRKFRISLESRDKHGALIDSELLAEVCVELNGGRQSTLFSGFEPREARVETTDEEIAPTETFVLEATSEERARHADLVAKIPNAIWEKYTTPEIREDAA